MIDKAVSQLESMLISIAELNAFDKLAYDAGDQADIVSRVGAKSSPQHTSQSATKAPSKVLSKSYSDNALRNTEGESVRSPLEGLASVLLPLIKEKGEWHILLTLRAENMRHHGGEVAFPGGMWEPEDDNLVVTALRECEEEIAIAPNQVSVLGGLQPSYTRNLTRVRPIVGIIDSTEEMKASPNEIAEIFTVPVKFFINDIRIRTDVFTHKNSGSTHWVPAYDYQGYEIWGFTASVIVQLINRCFVDGGISGNSGNSTKLTSHTTEIVRQHNAPEKVWKY